MKKLNRIELKGSKHFQSKLISMEAAAAMVKSGDTVASPVGYSGLLWDAIAARKDELKDVTIICSVPYSDPGWYSSDMSGAFNLIVGIFLGAWTRRGHDERRVDFWPATNGTEFKTFEDDRPEKRTIDLFILQVSRPDDKGFVGLPRDVWDKKNFVRYAKTVIAEVNDRIPPAYGNASLHISEIDYFVEGTPPPLTEEEISRFVDSFPSEKRERIRALIKHFPPYVVRRLLPALSTLSSAQVERTLNIDEPDEVSSRIAAHLKPLLHDRDTIQVGTGHPASYIVRCGVFDELNDLGIFSELAIPGMGDLIRKGIVTGKYCSLHPGKSVFSSRTSMDGEEREWCDSNPLVDLCDANYVVNIPNIAAQHQMVSVNNILQVDLTGQITAETQFGSRLINGPGGQFEFQVGAFLSKGGRAISLLYSTAFGGSVSTIVPQLDTGSVVTVPRTYADIIVTEWGVARLAGKSNRERAEALIAIAHPDFRAELTEKAGVLFWP
jgi:4-hydroxybutyrate CoA-transferase